MVVEKERYTVDEFDSLLALPENRERLFELVNGAIVEKVPTEEHGMIVLRLGSEILTNGSQMYPAKRLIEVHDADDFVILDADDTLDGGDVLPGFTLAVEEIFPV